LKKSYSKTNRPGILLKNYSGEILIDFGALIMETKFSPPMESSTEPKTTGRQTLVSSRSGGQV